MTLLSIGLPLYGFLKKAAGMPVYHEGAGDDKPLPYVTYARTGLAPVDVKNGANVESATVGISIRTGNYESGIAAAEAVRQALAVEDYQSWNVPVRRIGVADASEDWDYMAGCYVQNLTILCTK